MTDQSEELKALTAQVAELRGGLERVISVAFEECQPDRGDLFSKIDDIARALLASPAPEVKGEAKCVTAMTTDCQMRGCPKHDPAPSVGMVSREEHEKMVADVAACMAFLESELSWANFRADGWVGKESTSQSEVNARKLRAFLGDKHPGTALLEEVERLRTTMQHNAPCPACNELIGWGESHVCPPKMYALQERIEDLTEAARKAKEALNLVMRAGSPGVEVAIAIAALDASLKDGGGK